MQLALAAGERLAAHEESGTTIDPPNIANEICILSGGTDGEDGPTDAAGAFIDGDLLARASEAGLEPVDYLRRNDAYHFFQPLGGLLMTGPTNTNVGDIRVAVVARVQGVDSTG